MVLRILQTGGGEACRNQCGWMRETDQCGWVRKAKRSSGSAERSGLAGRSGGLAGRSGGLAGRSGGLAERERQQSFVERQSFWVHKAKRSRGLAERSGGLAGRGRRRSFVERQSFWVFPLHHQRVFWRTNEPHVAEYQHQSAAPYVSITSPVDFLLSRISSHRRPRSHDATSAEPPRTGRCYAKGWTYRRRRLI